MKNCVRAPPPSAYPSESWSLPRTCPLSGNTAKNKQWSSQSENHTVQNQMLFQTHRGLVCNTAANLCLLFVSSLIQLIDSRRRACGPKLRATFTTNLAWNLSGVYSNIFVQRCSLVNYDSTCSVFSNFLQWQRKAEAKLLINELPWGWGRLLKCKIISQRTQTFADLQLSRVQMFSMAKCPCLDCSWF